MAVQMEENQIILLTIKTIGINGEGIGYYKRKAVFVDGAIPPEEVIVKVTDVENKYATGEIVRIKKRAASRIRPFCKYYDKCGGCQLQHIKYSEQLLLKQEMLQQSFERYTTLDMTKLPVGLTQGMNKPKNYRYKAQMPVRNTESGLTTGLYEKDSNDLVDIVHCPVHNDDINNLMEATIKIMDEHNIYAFDTNTMRGLLRYIVIRQSESTKEVQITLVITIYNHALKRAARDLIQLPYVESVAISKNRDKESVAIFGETVEILEGRNYITEKIDDVVYHLKPKAFYQLNPLQAKKMYSYVKSLLDFTKDKTIIDAYCGAGAIGLYLAKDAKKVVGIDNEKESIYSAIHNVKINNFDNVSFELGDVSESLKKLFDKGLKPDTIIFDPPRTGLDYQTIDFLQRSNINKIIYISCNPSTLAKNIKKLQSKYDVKSIQAFDMFPHTSHIESVTLLERN